MTVKRPRGICPQCGQKKAVTTQARIWAHDILVSNHFGLVSKQLCPGTGRRPLVKADR